MSHRHRDDKPHLWDLPPKDNRGGDHNTDGEHEARCTVQGCRARITIDPNDSTEYGHQPGCPHRPNSLSVKGEGLSKINTDLVCPVCGRGDFAARGNLNRHISGVHTNPCRECGREFPSERERELHQIREHTDAEPEFCPTCDAVFETAQGCGSHLVQVHENACQECGQEFETERERDVHRILTHTDAETVHECPTCDAVFETWSKVKTHHPRVHDERLVELVTCARDGCEETFEKSSERRYCSESCAATDRAEWVDQECVICGAGYQVLPCHVDRRATCGDSECESAAQSRRFDATCVDCGAEFRNSFATEGCERCWDCRDDEDIPTSNQAAPPAEIRTGGVAGD